MWGPGKKSHGFSLSTHTRARTHLRKEESITKEVWGLGPTFICVVNKSYAAKTVYSTMVNICAICLAVTETVFLWPRMIFSWNIDCFFEEREIFGFSKVDGMFLQLYLYWNVIFLVRRGLNSGRGKTFSVLQNVETESGTHATSYTIGAGSLSQEQNGQSVMLTTPQPSAATLRINGPLTLLLLHRLWRGQRQIFFVLNLFFQGMKLDSCFTIKQKCSGDKK